VLQLNKKSLYWGVLGLLSLGATNWMALRWIDNKPGLKAVLSRLGLVHFCTIGFAVMLFLTMGLAQLMLNWPGFFSQLSILGYGLFWSLLSLVMFGIYRFINPFKSASRWDKLLGFALLLLSCVLPINLYGFYLGSHLTNKVSAPHTPWYDTLVVLVSLLILVPATYMGFFVFIVSFTCSPSNPGGCP
jgi:hypothetical protein